MNIQRFHAPTSREALQKARMAFGDGTVILANRPTATGVEVMATAEDALASLDSTPSARSSSPARATSSLTAPTPSPAFTAPAVKKMTALASAKTQVSEDTEQLAMSTLSFQDYVRERLLQRRQDAFQVIPAPSPQAVNTRSSPLTPSAAKPQQQPRAADTKATKPAPAASAQTASGISSELQAMKAMIEERFNTFAWLGRTRQNPITSNLMLKLIRAGYSPSLARAVLAKIPENASPADSLRLMIDVLGRNLRTDAHSVALHESGGVHALVGATGVGKTTTAAKLAGLCARVHGAGSVGLITLDTYRIGAHEQLRNYGRMLGVVAHLAHDRAALQDLLNLLANKKLVIIDTTGLAPRDASKREMLETIDLPSVNRLLVLNTVGPGDAQDEAISAFRGNGQQQAILTKLDEAVKLAPTLDACIRHQLVLRGLTIGQKAPQDWEAASAAKLIRMTMRSAGKSAFDPQMGDLGFHFTDSTSSTGLDSRA